VYKLTGHLQRSQPQQKLGVLYVVDSVIRQWMDRATAAGQDPTAPQPQNGTFAGGIRRLRDILPVMMADVIQCAPDDQKVCLDVLKSD
jgi:protein NRD1